MDILSITDPVKLFPNKDTIRQDFKKLVKKYHPDVSKYPPEYMARINLLYQKAMLLKDSDKYVMEDIPVFISDTGIHIDFEYELNYSTKAYDLFISKDETKIMYTGIPDALIINAKRIYNHFEFENNAMKVEMERFLPGDTKFGKYMGKNAIMISKTKDMLSFRVIPPTCEPVHVGWVLNSLYNIACYLYVRQISHNAILKDFIFISAEQHNVSLLGGWWFALPYGAKLKAIPRETFDLMGKYSDFVSSPLIDLELIKGFGRELLGDRLGLTLTSNPNIPEPMKNWLLCGVTNTDTVKEYDIWKNKILEQCFGKPKFVKFDIHDYSSKKSRKKYF